MLFSFLEVRPAYFSGTYMFFSREELKLSSRAMERRPPIKKQPTPIPEFDNVPGGHLGRFLPDPWFGRGTMLIASRFLRVTISV